MRTWVKRAVPTRILCALALVMLGFGGHAFADPSSDPFSNQYELPDGTYTSLCQPGDDKGGAPHDGAHHCVTCFVAAGHVFAPPEGAAAGLPVSGAGEIIGFAAVANPKPIHSHHCLGRGPPLFA